MADRPNIQCVLELDRIANADPFSESELVAYMRPRTIVGKVAIDQSNMNTKDLIRGFVLYEHTKAGLYITKLAVDPAYQRCGIGRQIIEHLKIKDRNMLVMVPEKCVAAQQFLAAMGFSVRGIHHKICDEDQDGYEMVSIISLPQSESVDTVVPPFPHTETQ